ncbi:MAG: pentapeptide repeat-containing protein, partial [Leptolyngbyaceae cyanobacterium]
DLSGSMLRGDLIHRADLRKANLETAKLFKANLERADLRRANLKMADLRKANLYMADLRGAILEEANFSGANLYGARLYGARRTGMQINNAIIRETLLENSIQVESEDHLNEEYEDTYDFSLLYPKKLAKGHSSRLTVQIYLPFRRAEIAEKIKSQMGQVDFKLLEKLYESQVRVGTHVIVRPFCPGIAFQPEEIRKFLYKPINLTNINMKPVDECLHGRHEAVLTIVDVKTGDEFESIPFTLMVDDYAFDHVSRPLVSYISAAGGTLSSIALFVLTFLQQIDVALGMTAGSAAMIFAAFYGVRPSITYTRSVTNSSSQQP